MKKTIKNEEIYILEDVKKWSDDNAYFDFVDVTYDGIYVKGEEFSDEHILSVINTENGIIYSLELEGFLLEDYIDDLKICENYDELMDLEDMYRSRLEDEYPEVLEKLDELFFGRYIYQYFYLALGRYITHLESKQNLIKLQKNIRKIRQEEQNAK